MYENDLLQIDADTYILAYGGSDATSHSSYGQHIKTFKVKPDGSSIVQIGDLRHDTYNISTDYVSLVKVDHDTYALAMMMVTMMMVTKIWVGLSKMVLG